MMMTFANSYRDDTVRPSLIAYYCKPNLDPATRVALAFTPLTTTCNPIKRTGAVVELGVCQQKIAREPSDVIPVAVMENLC